LNVHHRRRGDHTQLVTLCAGCHARVHRTRVLRRWVPEILVALWREWHPDAVEQLQLPVELSAAPPSGAGWHTFSGFPLRIVAGQLPEDASDGGGKYSRVFFPNPAQYRFDWALETSDSRTRGDADDILAEFHKSRGPAHQGVWTGYGQN
jgi:hypothetical protein